MKMIHVLLIIIFITGAILGIKIYNSNKELPYSLQDIQAILDKANDITNYECVIGPYHYKRKDHKVYSYDEQTDLIMITDYFENKEIMYYKTPKNNEKFYIEKEPSISNISSSNRLIIGNSILTKGTQLISAKEEKLHGVNTIKVKLRGSASMLFGESTDFDISIWINIDNGLIMQASMLGKKIEFTYKYNTVSNEEVNPDLSGYEKNIINF